MQISAQTILLGATPRNKLEAIELAGITLVDAGLIERAYIESMVERELHSDTFLGHGIAIPHGMAPDRHLIKRTGVSVVQIPRGVEWNDGERVDLVVAIAAKSDEHLNILAALTDVLDDEELIGRLSQTKNVEDIVAALGGKRQTEEGTAEAFEGQTIEAKVVGYAGLHARPAARLSEIASQFKSKIRIEYGTRSASPDAVISILKLGVAGGETVRIVAQGTDAQQALEVLKREIESGLGDDLEAPLPASSSVQSLFAPMSEAPFLKGVKAAPGLAIAPLHFLRKGSLQIEETGGDFGTECAKLQLSLKSAREELLRLKQEVEGRGGRDEAAIFTAQLSLQEDPELLTESENLIREGKNAAWAWNKTVTERAEEMRGSSNARLAERSVDLEDVGARVLRFMGIVSTESSLPEHPVILVAGDLSPSQVVGLDTKRVVGICTAEGGPTSHTAILASSLKLPLIVAMGGEVLELANDGALCVLDGNAGRLYSQLSEDDLKAARELQEQLRQQEDAAFGERYRPALMRDGHRMEVVANIGVANEAAKALENGAEGVGLLRTEFLFLHRDSAPSEEEQFAALCEMNDALNGLPLTVRTLDIGGDKTAPYLPIPHEENPFLGVRGMRLTLRRPELFKTQLRAVFRASETGPIRLLFPMIGTLEEWRKARDFAETVREEVGALSVEYGVMVEVPSAALMAREFAEEVDFFSIGTNDLTQYTLAVDRLHPELSGEADSLHPAVLRLIAMTVEAAKEKKKKVSVCGNIGDDALGALVLSGLGVNTLSLSIPAIARVKAALRQTDTISSQRLAQRALACRTAAEVRALGEQL
ncbi:phosphoenolpyruvate--protein phosphotransferase [bacterium]|nr:MAG: phosphoenolpyruvate--protein phosphotransferase [bacterium]